MNKNARIKITVDVDGKQQVVDLDEALQESGQSAGQFGSDISGASNEVSSFSQTIDNTIDNLDKISRKLTDVGTSLSKYVTAPIVGAVTGLFMLQKRTGEWADELLDLAGITGINVQSLQEFQNVSLVAGTDINALSNATSGLVRRLSQIRSGTGSASDALQTLGISAFNSNGELRNTEDLVMDIIHGLGGLQNSLQRAEMANDLFGRRWEQIAPIIDMGSEAIERVRNEADTLDQEALESANEFRIEWEMLQRELMTTARTIAIDLMPMIQSMIPLLRRLGDRVISVVEWFTDLDDATQLWILRISGLTAVVGPLMIILGQTTIVIRGVFLGIRGLVSIMPSLIGYIRALTVAMMANPWIAVGTAVLALAGYLFRVNSKLRDQRDLIEDVLDMEPTGTADEFNRTEEALEGLENRLERIKSQNVEYGIEGTEIAEKRIDEIKDEIDQVKELQRQIKIKQTLRGIRNLDELFAQKSDEELERLFSEEFDPEVGETTDEIKSLNDVMDENRNRIHDLIHMKGDLNESQFQEIINLRDENDEIEDQIELREKLIGILRRQDEISKPIEQRRTDVILPDDSDHSLPTDPNLLAPIENVPTGTLDKIKGDMRELNDITHLVQDALQDLAIEGFQFLGNAIGDLLTDDFSAEKMFAGFLQSLGSVMQEFGRAVFLFGLGAEWLKPSNLFSNVGPTKAMMAGTALIAGGALLSRASQNLAGVTGSQQIRDQRFERQMSGFSGLQSESDNQFGTGSSMKLKITDGMDKIVGEGQLIIERSNQKYRFSD